MRRIPVFYLKSAVSNQLFHEMSDLKRCRIKMLCLREAEAFFHRFADGFEDVLIACAAAEVTGEKLAQLIIRVIFAGFEDRRHSVNFSGRI